MMIASNKTNINEYESKQLNAGCDMRRGYCCQILRSSNYNKYHQHSKKYSTKMRRRSGGIHSSSEKEYVELADFAQQCSSLFYDQHKPTSSSKRRKYAFSVGSIDTNAKTQSNVKQKSAKIVKTFEKFDYDQQTYTFQKDCVELKKLQEKISKSAIKTHFAILSTQNTCITIAQLQIALGIQTKKPQISSRVLNLCIHRYFLSKTNTLYIDCFWVIDKTQSQQFSSLLSVYIDKCSHLLDLTCPKIGQMCEKDREMSEGTILKTMIDQINHKRFEEDCIQKQNAQFCQIQHSQS